MAACELSIAAAKDLADIYYTGVVNFGQQQADAYYARLVARLNRIGATPLLYPDVSHIRDQYRRSG